MDIIKSEYDKAEKTHIGSLIADNDLIKKAMAEEPKFAAVLTNTGFKTEYEINDTKSVRIEVEPFKQKFNIGFKVKF